MGSHSGSTTGQAVWTLQMGVHTHLITCRAAIPFT